MKISDLVTETGINRGTITRLYHETYSRVDVEVIDQLCDFFDCSVCELLERVD